MESVQAISLVDYIEYSAGSVVSKTLIKQPNGTVTLFAFDTGQELSEHTSPYEAVVTMLDGSAEWTVGGTTVTARAGTMVMLPANVPHGVVAREPFKMLLTMIRS